MSDESEKSHEPTQKKLDDARMRGEFVRSAEIGTATGYAAFFTALAVLGGAAMMNLGAFLQTFLEDPMSATLVNSIWQPILISLPILGFCALIVLVSYGVQKAIVFTPSKIAFKLSRISILSNAKNKFGASGLFEFAKSAVKLSVFSLVLTALLVSRGNQIIALSSASAAQSMAYLSELTLIFLATVCIAAALIAVVDYIWQHASHMRKNRMSRKELTDEMKNSEGDPALKGRRRQKAVDIAMNQMMIDVQTADVVIVNPTHFAVALSWDKSSGRAPTCVAKGVDEVAAQIRRVAQENGVPVRSDPPTARALFATVEIGADVPSAHFRAVAAAIRFAERIRKKAAAK